jgi:Glyoxalase-like domain
MTSRISHTTIDCEDAYALSNWWKKVLKVEGPRLLFIEVPEAKSVKNRLHFDLRPTDRTRDEEFDRVLKLGAKYVADHRGIHGPGTGWIVLTDPEGNEFCILRSDAEVEAQAAGGS